MSASTPAEFVALVPTAGFSFDDFGNATQGDVDDLKNRVELSYKASGLAIPIDEVRKGDAY
jgi:hypothetical protein